MYSHAPANYVCPLCQIAKGQMTSRGSNEEAVIFRNDLITVFVAGKWWAAAPGHVIIIPNSHVENIYMLPDEIGHEISSMSKRVAIALKESRGCEGVSILQHNEPVGDQEVWHYHMHILPRVSGYDFHTDFHKTSWAGIDTRRKAAENLKNYIR